LGRNSLHRHGTGRRIQYYLTPKEAYAAAVSGDTIQTRSASITGDLVFDRAINVLIKGGYNASFTDNSLSNTLVNGTLTISNGTVTVEKLIMQ
jgi:hypothetical protein